MARPWRGRQTRTVAFDIAPLSHGTHSTESTNQNHSFRYLFVIPWLDPDGTDKLKPWLSISLCYPMARPCRGRQTGAMALDNASLSHGSTPSEPPTLGIIYQNPRQQPSQKHTPYQRTNLPGRHNPDGQSL